MRMYNKDKCNKYIVDFFILADTQYYFIYNIDVYQGKNTESIDIHPSLNNIPTPQQCGANAIIKSGIENYPHGPIHIYIYMYDIYASPQIFALMDRNYNIKAEGICRYNRKKLTMNSYCWIKN